MQDDQKIRDDEGIRAQRLLFYKDDMDKIDELLKEFLELSKAKCALLIDKDGHMVTKHGQTGTYDMDTISALVAGSFAATKEMARLLGEEEFSVLYHQGQEDNIQLSLIGDRTLLAVIFDDKTTLGMVRLYANEIAKKLTALFEEISRRKQPEGPAIGEDFQKAAEGKLDEIFGQ
jgi:predicted regulator of Ras-like GTPase activity (Roadblock/LC7/MglB family)